MEAGSLYSGRLPRGCVLCRRGTKMVLLVSGRCSTGCFYCPLSLEKKGKAVIFANELKAADDEDVLREAEIMGAEGTGITGGDPVACLDQTVRFIRLLKERFGKRHHIHLYTSSLDTGAFETLEEAGLDELRLHPPVEMWDRLRSTDIADFKKVSKMKMGFEVPVIPGEEERLRALLEYAQDAGIDFVNLNELEFSEGNWDAMLEKGFAIKGDVSAAVRGSEDLGLRMVNLGLKVPVHYCSSSFKDSVQLRQRIKRRARRIARPYDIVTADGTLFKGVVDGPMDEVMTLLREKFGVPDELMARDEEKKRVEVASWVLEEIAPQLPYDSYLVEEYPTADRLEVEREPLRPR
jgi:pyruvate formate-lyase activating enzyme-like uncharacterized protein